MSLMAFPARNSALEAGSRSPQRGTLSPSLSTTSTVSGHSDAQVRLQIFYRGDFVLSFDGCWKYKGGESLLVSIPYNFLYSDLMHRLSEKTDPGVSAKFLQPTEALDPENLISIMDDEDVKEMFDEYSNLKQENPTGRLRVYLFPGTDDTCYPLSPEEYEAGEAFLASIPDKAGGMLTQGPRTNNSNGSDHSSDCANGGGAKRDNSRGGQPNFGGSWGYGGSHLQQNGGQFAWPGEAGALHHRLDHYSGGVVGYSTDLACEEQAMEISQISGGTDMSDGKSYYFHTQDPGILGMPIGIRPSSIIQAYGDGPIAQGSKEVWKPRRGVGQGVNLPTSISILGIKGDSFVEHGAGLNSHALVDIECTPRGPPGRAGSAASSMHRTSVPSSPLTQNTSGSSSITSVVHRVPKADVKVLRRIGEGAFGEVSLAHCSTFGKVAVKWLKPAKMEKHSASFWKEADTLSALNHPNVLRFYGVVIESHDDPAVVGIMTEYMRGGSLSHVLRTPGKFPLKLRPRAELALGAVNGMAYLHEMSIVHFDLKPDNLLLEHSHLHRPLAFWDGLSEWEMPNLKVADFGLSKHKHKPFVSGVHDLRGTLPYMAPELVSDPQHVTEKADVWSMGMCMWEMLTGQTPFHALTPQSIIAGLMVGNLQPEVPEYCEDDWRNIMALCWVPCPADRPSFRQLAVMLQDIIDRHP